MIENILSFWNIGEKILDFFKRPSIKFHIEERIDVSFWDSSIPFILYLEVVNHKDYPITIRKITGITKDTTLEEEIVPIITPKNNLGTKLNFTDSMRIMLNASVLEYYSKIFVYDNF